MVTATEQPMVPGRTTCGVPRDKGDPRDRRAVREGLYLAKEHVPVDTRAASGVEINLEEPFLSLLSLIFSTRAPTLKPWI